MQPINIKSEENKDSSNRVNFAYSVTLLHHSCVIHCIIPTIPCNEAKVVRPTFKLCGGKLYRILFYIKNNIFCILDHHMMVFIPGYFTHLLDIGINHEPCCHIMIPKPLQKTENYLMKLVPLSNDSDLVINLNTLEVFPLVVNNSHLIETFKKNNHLENKISIIHYLLVHLNEADVVAEVSLIDTQ